MRSMPSVVALQRWLVAVSMLRLLSVYLGYLNVTYLSTNLFDIGANAVTDLNGRTFAMWTALSSILCLYCAKNPHNRAVYSATLLSFILALLFFLGELTFYKTLSLKSALQPMIVASVSVLWLGLGFNYYTSYASEPSEELDSRLQQKRA